MLLDAEHVLYIVFDAELRRIVLHTVQRFGQE